MYWEEFEPGRRISTEPREMTIQDLDEFTALSRLDNPLFTSREGALARGHADRLVPAPWQLSVAMGLCQQAGLFDHVVAVLGFDRMRFRRPVHPGHLLRVEAEVLEVTSSPRPGQGMVTLQYALLNQDDQEVMTCRALYLMARQPA